MESQLLEMGQLSFPMLGCREFVFWLPLSSSSIREALLPPSPLRTTRADFTACRSSLSNAPCATRVRYGETLAMRSLMAFWVEQDAIVCLIFASLVNADVSGSFTCGGTVTHSWHRRFCLEAGNALRDSHC